jgi:hypothetical protein
LTVVADGATVMSPPSFVTLSPSTPLGINSVEGLSKGAPARRNNYEYNDGAGALE